MKKCFIVLLMLLFITGLYAGVQESPTESQDTWEITLPGVECDTAALDVHFQTQPMVTFAEVLPVNLDMCEIGKWTQSDNGTREWTTKLVSPGATSLQLEFNRLFLPKGTQLALRNKDGKLMELYTAENIKEAETFLSGLYPGNELTLTYYEPDGTDEIVDLRIGKVMQGFRDIFTMPRGYDAAGLIIVDGVRAGYGLLVNNTAKDFKPYFLTSLKCIIADGVLEDNEINALHKWQFCFKSQQASENGTHSWVTHQGATVASLSQKSGYALLELSESPFSKNAKLVYYGWAPQDSNGEQAHRVPVTHAHVTGLPPINGQNQIIGDIFARKQWRSPQTGNRAGVNNSTESTAKQFLDPLNSELVSLPELDPPRIIPDEDTVACDWKTFDITLRDCPCYKYQWYCSSNLEVQGGLNNKTVKVRAKNGYSGAGSVHCIANDGVSEVGNAKETFNVVGFNAYISPNISTLCRGQRQTFTASTPSGCPASTYTWSYSSCLIPIGPTNESQITLEAREGCNENVCVTVTATNTYGDTDTACECFNVVDCDPLTLLKLSSPKTTPLLCDSNYKFDAIGPSNADYNWSVFGGAINSGQGTPTVQIAPYCTSSLLRVTVTVSNCCNSLSKSVSISVDNSKN